MFALSQGVKRAGLHRASISTSCPSLPKRPSSSATLRVVAFREDERDVGQSLRRGTRDTARNAKAQGRNLQRQAQDVANRGRDNIRNVQRQGQSTAQRGRRRLEDNDLDEMVSRNTPTVYNANAIVLALAAGVAATSPGLAANIGFIAGGNAAFMPPLFAIWSLGLSAAAVVNYVQSGGAAADELDSTLHKRLNAALSTFSVAQLGLLGLCLTPLSRSILLGSSGTEVLNTGGIAALGVGVAIQLYVAGVNYARNSPEGYDVVADAKSWLKDASNTFSGLDGPISTGYAVVTASLLAAGLGYIFAPYPTLMGVFGSSARAAGPEAIVMWQLIGAGVSMIVGPITYSLKEAASANSLSDPRFKLLNIALFTAGAGHLLVLAPRLGDSMNAGPLLPVVLGTWAAAGALGAINLLQKPGGARSSRR